MRTNQASFANIDAVDDYEDIEQNLEQDKIYSKELVYEKQKSLIVTYTSMAVHRTVDVFAGIIGLVLLSLLIPIIYIANKIAKNDGPLFYFQERIGKNGKIFRMYKFRSMVLGADEKLKNYLEENEEAAIEYKKYKKLKNDPRVTSIGEFLRKTSLDEMPQFLNLLNGSMSLVGPRPYMPREKEDMGLYYDIIIKNKPGITGYWQISGRSNATFNDRLDMDIRYHRNKSLKNDFIILIKTFLLVFKREGAI